MSAQLDFPPIAEEAPALALVAAAQPATADLANIDLQAAALAQFGDWRKDVDVAKKKLTDVVLDLSTQSKVDEAKSLRQRTVNTPIAEVRKVSKALKSKLASVSKAIGAEEEQAVAAWTGVGELLTPQIDKRQAELDEERARKAQGEAFRKALHLALIERIKGYVEQATGLPSERIGAGVTFVQGLAFGDECQEFLPQYRAAHASALATLITMRDDAKAREDAEALRLENERVAAELAAQKKALEDQAADLLRQRVAATHAILFTFPEPEPVAPAVATEITEAQPPQQVLKAEPAPVLADATDRGQAVNVSPRGGAMGAGQATAVDPACGPVAVIRVPQPDSEPPAPLPPAKAYSSMDEARAIMAATSDVRAIPMGLPSTNEAATLKLGTICERLGITMTAAFVADVLGMPAATTDKRAVLYRESDFGLICDALVIHVQKCKTTAPAEVLAA